MAFWTPRNLADIGYIQANFTDRDKSLALDQSLRLLPDAIKNEARLSAQELELRDQLNNGPYSFGNVRTLRQRNTELQNDPNATAQQRADAYTAWQNAQAERDSLNSTYTQVNNNLTAANEYTNNLEQGIANLRQLGATAPTSSTQPSGNEKLAQPQEVVPGPNGDITVTTSTPNIASEPSPNTPPENLVSTQQPTNISPTNNAFNEFETDTNLVVQGIDVAPATVEPLAGQQSTNISLGTNPLNEFATDTLTQEVADEPSNDAGGEDPVIPQTNTNESNVLAQDRVESDDDNLTADEDPNLTALEAGDNESVESDDDNVTADEDPNLTALEAGDNDEIVIRQRDTTDGDQKEDNDTNQDQVESTDPGNNTTTNTRGITSSVSNTRNQADLQYGINFAQLEDWRVRLKLAPSANYLYKATNPGILAPLKATDGVIFPYTPQVTVNYVANYDPTNPTHSNYKILQYQNSAVDSVQIACDFTAQDTQEANYLLATIHFLRSVTKMFYGQDENPKRGTPPPLCYLKGLGAFQFDMHPLVVTSFAYTLPDDVDYIRAMEPSSTVGSNVNNSGQGSTNNALIGTGVQQGGVAPSPNFNNQTNNQLSQPTYVPTKIKLTIMCMPVVSRKDISDSFSLKDYATGTLLQGSKRSGGGIW